MDRHWDQALEEGRCLRTLDQCIRDTPCTVVLCLYVQVPWLDAVGAAEVFSSDLALWCLEA